MKTKEQILGWLDKQPWKGEFYEEVFLNVYGHQIPFNEDFIISSFGWGVTKSGIDAWEQRHKDYLKWYNDSGRPATWEEYCAQNPIVEGEYYINDCSDILHVSPGERDKDDDINVMSEKLCKAFRAHMKLIQLRNAWVRGSEDTSCIFKILAIDGEISVYSLLLCASGLSFPTDDMALDFLKTFKELLEVAKPLL